MNDEPSLIVAAIFEAVEACKIRSGLEQFKYYVLIPGLPAGEGGEYELPSTAPGK